MDDFIAFLAVGMIAVIGMLFIFSGLQFIEGVPVPGGEFREFINESEIIGTVGPVGVDTLKLIDMGAVNVSYIKDTRTIGLGAREIYNGLLFGSSSVKYNFETEIDSLDVIFTVDRTNNYAPLQVKVNGRIVAEERFSEGEHKLSVDKSLLAQKNAIEISSLSSSWRIWAPALYKLGEVKFVVKSLSQKSSSFSFAMDKEYDAFKSGKIDLALEENIGTFMAEMNGKAVYSSPVSNLQSISFDKSALGKNNTLVLKAGLNSRFFGKATMKITYVAEKENIIELPFNVSDVDYNRFTTGFVEFRVVSVSRKGGINVRIEKDTLPLLNEYDSVTEKTYTFTLRKTNVRPGVNKLVIKSMDSAIFSVKGAQIVY